jgi:glycosyltransferase involved in cell wall biosynthesis
MCTKDSVKPCLERLLVRIREDMPVNDLIVVDGGSTDGTVELAEKYGARVLQLGFGNRGIQKQMSMDAAKTDLFVTVDSDMIPPRGWFKSVYSQLDPETTAVTTAYREVDQKGLSPAYRAWSVMEGRTVSYSMPTEWINGVVLFRRSAMTDLKIPRDMHVGDYLIIGQYMKSHGNKWKVNTEAIVTHYRDPSESRGVFDPWEQKLYGHLMRKYKLATRKTMLRLLVRSSLQALVILVAGRSLSVSLSRLRIGWMRTICFFVT